MKNSNRQSYFQQIQPSKTALLVIDMQNHWVDERGLDYVHGAKDIVKNINKLASELRSRQGTIVWIISTFQLDGRSSWPMLFQHLSETDDGRCVRDALMEGNPMHELWAGLDHQPSDLTVHKDRFSAFIQGASSLENELRKRRIDTVLITGVATNICCESTARDAMMLDFRTIMIDDANAARTKKDHVCGLRTFSQVFGIVLSTQDVIARL